MTAFKINVVLVVAGFVGTQKASIIMQDRCHLPVPGPKWDSFLRGRRIHTQSKYLFLFPFSVCVCMIGLWYRSGFTSYFIPIEYIFKKYLNLLKSIFFFFSPPLISRFSPNCYISVLMILLFNQFSSQIHWEFSQLRSTDQSALCWAVD